jgi:hypothetical protein
MRTACLQDSLGVRYPRASTGGSGVPWGRIDREGWDIVTAYGQPG